jgi:hypothetical protein
MLLLAIKSRHQDKTHCKKRKNREKHKELVLRKHKFVIMMITEQTPP